jgi:hypothetical protein
MTLHRCAALAHAPLLFYNYRCDLCPSPLAYLWHGYQIHHSDMINHRNDTCKAARDDILGTTRPRDVRLQIYISMTLGVGAFLVFCVRLSRLPFQKPRHLPLSTVPPTAMEGPVRCAQEAEQPRDRASRPSGFLLRLDHTTMEDHGRASSGFGWP